MKEARGSMPWTILVYMAGDNDLDDEAVDDIREMLLHGSGPEVRIAVQIDRHRKPSRRYVIPEQPGTSFAEATMRADTLPEINTGDPRVLADFLTWGRAKFPAKYTGLVLWNHGLGWMPYDLEVFGRSAITAAVSVPPLFPSDHPRRGTFRALAPQRHALFLHREHLARVLEHTAYIGLDEGEALRPDALDTHEMGKVLAEHVAQHGRLDLVGFDACLMAQLEVAYEIKGAASVLVGSTEVEPGIGWPYHAIALRLKDKPKLTPAKLGREIAEAYIGVAHTLEGSDDDNNTQSVLRLRRVHDLARSTAALGAALTRALRKHRLVIRGTIAEVQHYDVRSYKDLGSLARVIAGAVPVRPVRQAARELLDVLDTVVLYHGEVGELVAGSTGISVYLPTTLREWRLYQRSYKALAFAKDHPEWVEFLSRLTASVSLGG